MNRFSINPMRSTIDKPHAGLPLALFFHVPLLLLPLVFWMNLPEELTCEPEDDNNPCTQDLCLEGEPTHLPTEGIACDDDDLCNGREICDANGICQPGTPLVVDDDVNICTLDSCHPTQGVVHSPQETGTPCDDDDVCNGREICDINGICQLGTPLVIDDGNLCTLDSCHPTQGVVHSPQETGTPCDDDDLCNGHEVCRNGLCSAGSPLEIDDGDECTMDSCDPFQGAIHQRIPGCGVICEEQSATFVTEFQGWQAIQYDVGVNSVPARWSVVPARPGLVQSNQSDPSIYLSDFDATDRFLEWEWRVGSTRSSNYAGFVFGFQDVGHYYLFDWKGMTSTERGEVAEVGMSVKVFDAEENQLDSLSLDLLDFWGRDKTQQVQVLEIDGFHYENDVPWQQNVTYRLSLEVHSGSFRIIVREPDDNILEDWSAYDDKYLAGKFGFYVFSLGPNDFNNLIWRPLLPECATVQLF